MYSPEGELEYPEQNWDEDGYIIRPSSEPEVPWPVGLKGHAHNRVTYPMANPPKAVIFDIGGVVVPSPIISVRQYEKKLSLPQVMIPPQTTWCHGACANTQVLKDYLNVQMCVRLCRPPPASI
jgi:hypothetical protein